MSLKKKLTDHNHDKYITTPEFNTLAANVFNARLAQANLITKTDFDAKLSSLNRKVAAWLCYVFVMFMILMLIMMLVMLMILLTLINI